MNRELILNLGKLMVAVAWIDGILAPQELDALRALIGRIPGIKPQEKAQIEVFMAHRVSDAERETLMRLVADLIKTDEEKAMVVSCLRNVVASDGEITSDEEAALAALEESISRADVGMLGSLGRMIWRGVTRQQALPDTLAREEHLDDFMRNRVFYYLMLDPKGEALVRALGEEKARLVSLVAGLMLRVACAGREKPQLASKDGPPTGPLAARLMDQYELSDEQAQTFVDIAWLGYTRSLDGFLLGCALEAKANQEQLQACYAILLDLAHQDGNPSDAVTQELLDIAHSLLFDQAAIELAQQRRLHRSATS